jgi:cell fate regulator YaaT (PSP1 superfamily)
MQEFVEVVFRSQRTGYFVNTSGLGLEPDQQVICRVERGEDIGKILNCSYSDLELEERSKINEINPITRIATELDIEQINNIEEREKEAHLKFLKMVSKYPFEMKLIETIYQFDGNKLTFFFSADGRVDFRDFVRELATEFRTRIELHQTSGREDARRYGGYGMCGCQYCCVSFLKKFNQVSIQMAKDQNLIGNLSKISGPCGRLLCCLHYEEDFYLKKIEEFPVVGESIKRNGRNCTVVKNDYYNDQIFLKPPDDDLEILTFDQYKKLQKLEIDLTEKK